MKRSFVLILALLSGGCATFSRGFDVGALNQRLGPEAPQVTDADVQRVLSLRPQLRFPIRLGVYLHDYRWNDPSVWGGRSSRRYASPSPGQAGMALSEWTGEDKDMLLAARDALRQAGVVSDLFLIIPQAAGTGAEGGPDELKRIRLAAARHQADAVLVVRGAADLDPYYNLWTVLYPTIVGAGIFPGNNYGSLFRIRGGLWDVRNEYLYATMETEAEESTMAPAWWIDEKKALDASRKEALAAFRDEFVQRMKNLGAR